MRRSAATFFLPCFNQSTIRTVHLPQTPPHPAISRYRQPEGQMLSRLERAHNVCTHASSHSDMRGLSWPTSSMSTSACFTLGPGLSRAVMQYQYPMMVEPVAGELCRYMGTASDLESSVYRRGPATYRYLAQRIPSKLSIQPWFLDRAPYLARSPLPHLETRWRILQRGAVLLDGRGRHGSRRTG